MKNPALEGIGILRPVRKPLKLKTDSDLIEYSPTQELLDEEFIALAIWECLKNNDPEGVVEVIQAHLSAVNKVRAAKEILLPRSSMYNALKGKNPTVKTFERAFRSPCF